MRHTTTDTAGGVMEDWYAVGQPVGELAYLGHGHYESNLATVVRVTKSMVFTDSGRRFWRRTNGRNEVGSRDRQLITAKAVVFRLVPADHPHVAQPIGEAQ